jgi:hypothetical protein
MPLESATYSLYWYSATLSIPQGLARYKILVYNKEVKQKQYGNYYELKEYQRKQY